ncbi:vomeronasal type-2 receptor 26-like [Gastrophryne carolinensis]
MSQEFALYALEVLTFHEARKSFFISSDLRSYKSSVSIMRLTLQELTVRPRASQYRYIWSFIFAIEEINKNPNLLPNVTLGYNVYDSCKNENKAIESVLHILSGSGEIVPNYSCHDHDKLSGVIGDESSECSLHIYQILNLYGYSQVTDNHHEPPRWKMISYGATDPIFTNKQMFSSFFRTLPNDRILCLAIVLLLKHFNWTWIGVILTDDYTGEKQSQELIKMAATYGICIEFIISIQSETHSGGKKKRNISPESINIFNKSTAKVVIVCSGSLSTLRIIEEKLSRHSEKTFILAAGPLAHIEPALEKRSFHGSLAFSTVMIEMSSFQKFLDGISLISHPNDFFLQHLSATYSRCLTSNHVLNSLFQQFHRYRLHQCDSTTQFGNLSSYFGYRGKFGTAYHVYKAVYAMAHALHEMQLYVSDISRNISQRHHKHMFKGFLRRVRFKDPLGENIYFKEEGEMASSYGIYNFEITNKSIYRVRHFGLFNTISLKLIAFTPQDLTWRTDVVPFSQCSEECPKGYRRAIRPGSPRCCFDCVKCSDGEISNNTDKWFCEKCPEDQWTNDDDRCVPKRMEFLSYKKDTISIIVSIITSLCFVKSSIILSVFIIYRDTPVIRANNRNLSFLLLVSIMLSFLCVLLFIGHPGHVTCMARHTLYGITSSVTISSILAKTFMVYSAFRATKPGSSWRKFIGVKLTNCLVFICSFIQVLISLFWLLVSPPFPEKNTHLYQDIIIIQCNEGSVLAFSLLLGYMGLLAIVSFIVAFLARHLPDSFNEAKYITFSMLVFCSVWVTFIPAYLSATGKSTVLVEIFAIISSTVGILGCIFYPKCYIILLRPELNVKNVLLRCTK